MKQFLLFAILSIIFFSCQKKEALTHDEPSPDAIIEVKVNPDIVNNIIDPMMDLDSNHYQKAYDRLISQIKSEKSQLSNDNISMDSVSHYFTRIMRDSIFYYWYGTTWDFNGHTDTPRNGLVACGYFISTPLKHIGVNVNRFKLAQQAATPIIKSVAAGKDIYRTADVNELIDYLNKQPKDGIYVLGLSFHVGFILRENGNNFMVHSDYYEPVSVCKKSFASCEALHSSDVYMVGDLSHNPTFLKKWLSGERINILSQ